MPKISKRTKAHLAVGVGLAGGFLLFYAGDGPQLTYQVFVEPRQRLQLKSELESKIARISGKIVSIDKFSIEFYGEGDGLPESGLHHSTYQIASVKSDEGIKNF